MLDDVLAKFDEETVMEMPPNIDGDRLVEERKESEMELVSDTLLDVEPDKLEKTLSEAKGKNPGDTP